MIIDLRSGNAFPLEGGCQVGGTWGIRFIEENDVLTAGGDGRLLRWNTKTGVVFELMNAEKPIIAMATSRVTDEGLAVAFVRGHGPVKVDLGVSQERS